MESGNVLTTIVVFIGFLTAAQYISLSRAESIPNELTAKVKFHLFTRGNPEVSKEHNAANDQPLINSTDSKYRPNRPIKVFIPDWNSDYKSGVALKNEWLKREDCNFFIMDWKNLTTLATGERNYDMALKNTKPGAGVAIDQLVTSLVVKKKESILNFHFIGLGVGAHVAGAGADFVEQGRLPRITGLNPAKKGFPMDLSPKFRLDRSNAAYVDVIHTDWSEGEKPIGHADFYPNAGIQPQPGCPSADTGECNNQRALDLYVESINGNRFQSYRCASGIDDLKTKTCNGPPAPMGYPLSVGAKGVYYLVTNDKPPFAADAEHMETDLPSSPKATSSFLLWPLLALVTVIVIFNALLHSLPNIRSLWTESLEKISTIQSSLLRKYGGRLPTSLPSVKRVA